jgi:hypothetical protein
MLAEGGRGKGVVLARDKAQACQDCCGYACGGRGTGLLRLGLRREGRGQDC